ncbi:MAG: polysaccharide pyruvyl transferase family protein, partial [Frankiaceae bacterium]|nr:polysaccharide pyruvyl transferase family protein [Frankiaceae bacterium]
VDVTQRALGDFCGADRQPAILDESIALWRRDVRARPLVICGGGYLNGSWRAEIGGKLRRLVAISGSAPSALHAVELRELTAPPLAVLAGRLLRNARISVRDQPSATEAELIAGRGADVVPDAISLLQPRAAEFLRTAGAARRRGPILVNLLDVPGRNDCAEAEFPTDDWPARCRSLLAQIDGAVCGIAVDDSDGAFMARALGIQVVKPGTVAALFRLLLDARALISTRMHPGLIATMLGTPALVLPYCGKVRPTLARLGLGEAVAGPGSLEIPWEQILRQDFAAAWEANYAETSAWLACALKGL